jgi:hypothetical protein
MACTGFSSFDLPKGLVEIRDSGHTLICPMCSKRYGDSLSLVGKQRTIELKWCSGCESERVRFVRGLYKESATSK